jgi:hypothetical protein
MKTSYLYLVFAFFSITFFSHSQIIHVPQDQPTIQAGIDAADNHDTVLVDQGEYFENINFLGKNIVVCSHFALTNDLLDISTTIINGSSPVYADTGSCVLIVSGEDSTAVLQGFTITGGTGTRWEDEHNLNHWYTEGGGILIQYASPTIKNNIITENEAINKPAGTTSAGGGAIRCGDGNPQILNNIISNNQGRYGGGIVLNYSGAVIKNNIIKGNSGGEDYGGGGLWFLSNGVMPIILENNTIVNNLSATSGGGLRLWSSAATITNNIFWGNAANAAPQIQGSTGTVTYCCVEGSFNGTGNIDLDPLFLDNTFILTDNSPCIDAGSPEVIYYDPEDLGNPGFALYPAKGELHGDIGAFGGPGCMSLPVMTTGISDHNKNSYEFDVSLFPNPAQDFVALDNRNLATKDLKLYIYNMLGILVKSISLDQIQSQFYVGDLPNGYYIIEIKSVGNTEKQKLMIQR